MTHFVPTADLDQRVAEALLAPRIEHLGSRVEDEAKRGAPDAKTWLSARDERVRPSHVYADGQEVPDNLRYKIPKALDDNVATNGFDLARVPRDPALPIANRVNCRCESVPIPQAVARDISRTPTAVMGTVVRTTVTCTYPRAAEAEYGTDEDTGAHFMSGALHAVATEAR